MKLYYLLKLALKYCWLASKEMNGNGYKRNLKKNTPQQTKNPRKIDLDWTKENFVKGLGI
jgi:hypothetical protein